MNDRFRRLVVNWIPPSILKFAEILINYIRKPIYEFVSNRWLNDKKVVGWNSESVAEYRRNQWLKLKNSFQGTAPLGFDINYISLRSIKDIYNHNLFVSFAYVLALSARSKNRISILDWGGDIGSYRLISSSVLRGVHIDYYCAEVPVICNLGRELQPDIKFFSDRNEWQGKHFDLVFASSAIHYVREWRILIKDLIRVCTEYLYIARIPILQKEPSFVFIQRAYRTEYFGWAINKNELIRCVCENGFFLMREFVFHEGPRIHKAPEQNLYMGFLFKKL